SGSTGRPKGVEVTHRSAAHLVRAEGKLFGVRETDRCYHGSSVAFDASVEEIWLAWFAGAALVVGTAEMVRSGPALAGMLERAGGWRRRGRWASCTSAGLGWRGGTWGGRS